MTMHLDPTIADIEQALDAALTALVAHQQRQARAAAPEPVRFTRLDALPTLAVSARKALLRDPVEFSIHRGIAELGALLYGAGRSVAVMEATAERLAARAPAARSVRLSILNAAWDGIGAGQDRWCA